MAKLRLLIGVLTILLFVNVAGAQTACPYGATPGSVVCGPMPDSGASVPPPPPVPSGEWESKFGAIAIDLAANAVGTSDSHASRLKAEEAALLGCRIEGGVNCDLVAWAENQCLALAWPRGDGGGFAGTGRGKTQSQAEKKSLSNCKAHDGKCEVLWSKCNEPVFHRY